MPSDQVVGICPTCRRNVYFMESHYIDSGEDYHESCYVKHLCIVKKKLDTKKIKGSITLDEAQELKDTEQLLIRATSKDESCNMYSPKRKYDNLVCKPEIREDFLRSNLENKMKLLEKDRGQRWAFEVLNILDAQFYICAPEEKKQLSDGQNNVTV